VGNEELENWLVRLLEPRPHLKILEADLDGKHVVVFEVPPASHTPVRFRETEFIRVGSYKKKLKDYPEKERALWSLLSSTPFEQGIAARRVSGDQVLSLIDFPSYFEMTARPIPDSRSGMLSALAEEGIIARAGDDAFHITKLGAILFAKDLQSFDGLSRKGVRVVVYEGVNRVTTIREQDGRRGYASGFQGLVSFINGLLPHNEHIEQAVRRQVPVYPEIAVRELVANMLIHQDFSVTGAGPMVEIFSDRIEITNPGEPLIDVRRFLDLPPHSRNEALAALMRRMGVCEERGSGIDKVLFEIELYQLPPPDFAAVGRNTRVVLYTPRELSKMRKEDRGRACYQHASLRYVTGERMTNASLRARFKIEDKDYPVASRIIAETVRSGLVKPSDPESRSRKHASYLPYWA